MKKQMGGNTGSIKDRPKLDPGLAQSFGPSSVKDSTWKPESKHAGKFEGTNKAFSVGKGSSSKAIDKSEGKAIKKFSDSEPSPKKGTVSTKQMIHEKTAPVTFVGASGSGKNHT